MLRPGAMCAPLAHGNTRRISTRAAERAGIDGDGAAARAGAGRVIHQQPALAHRRAAVVRVRAGEQPTCRHLSFIEAAAVPLITPLRMPSMSAVPLTHCDFAQCPVEIDRILEIDRRVSPYRAHCKSTARGDEATGRPK